MGPILKIESLEFELERDFSDGYENDLQPPANLQFRTHPTMFLWKGGRFKDLNIAILLAVGVQSALKTADDLVAVLEMFHRYALSSNPGTNVPPNAITLQIGSWYQRKGRIRDLSVTYKDPWDMDTGKPMRAEVTFTFVTDFLTLDTTKLPSSRNFSYKFTAG